MFTENDSLYGAPEEIIHVEGGGYSMTNGTARIEGDDIGETNDLSADPAYQFSSLTSSGTSPGPNHAWPIH